MARPRRRGDGFGVIVRGGAAAAAAAAAAGDNDMNRNDRAAPTGTRKRPPPTGIAIGVGGSRNNNNNINTAEAAATTSSANNNGSKKIRVGTSIIAPPKEKAPQNAIKLEGSNTNHNNMNNTTTNNKNSNNTNIAGIAAIGSTGAVSHSNNNNDLKQRFLRLFDEQIDAVSNSMLKDKFKNNNEYSEMVPIINELMNESRLSMSQNSITGELYYSLVSSDIASKLVGLDNGAKMVYQVIQKAGDLGIWTKIIRTQTNIEQQTLNKIFKVLESRKLIKPVKSVTAKSKKIYMLYEITPAKELTGGVWYSDFEFDHEFINELRAFVMQCVRRLNNGCGVTARQILEKILQAKISKVELSVHEIQQLIETLMYDYLIEESTDSYNNNNSGIGDESEDILYVPARRVTPMSEFKWWNSVLATDFKYRTIKFEDGVTLSPHEPHYHT